MYSAKVCTQTKYSVFWGTLKKVQSIIKVRKYVNLDNWFPENWEFHVIRGFTCILEKHKMVEIWHEKENLYKADLETELT